ncbi:MAG: hypothetical protein VX867_03730, partial [Pseudomonadota bacterium]|nr:hypothetical protein [Pseudomonadota bacterium]
MHKFRFELSFSYWRSTHMISETAMWRKIVVTGLSACLLLSQSLTAEEPDPVEPLLLTAFE